jgi:hypothetical protein
MTDKTQAELFLAPSRLCSTAAGQTSGSRAAAADEALAAAGVPSSGWMLAEVTVWTGNVAGCCMAAAAHAS